MITGLSGSGKSSLAFDTIYAEGQRRYVETLSAYARQFLDQMERPDVDSIDGLSPAISIEQKTTSRSPRSTVGTITEIYDYLRLLYSSIGVPHCPNCGREISRQSAEQIVQRVMELKPDDRVMILAPIVRGRKGEFKKELDKLVQQGFIRARIDGELRNIADEEIKLDKRKNHTIEVVSRPAAGEATELSVGWPTAVELGDEDGGRPGTGGGGGRRGATVLVEAGVPGVRHQRSGAGAALVFVQQRVWRVPGVQWTGQQVRFRSGKGGHGLVEAAAGRRAGAGIGVAKLDPLACSLAAAAYGFDLAKPFEQLPRKTQNLILYGPERGEKKRGGFLGVFAYLRRHMEDSSSQGLSRLAAGSYVGDTLPGVRGQAAAPRKPGE